MITIFEIFINEYIEVTHNNTTGRIGDTSPLPTTDSGNWPGGNSGGIVGDFGVTFKPVGEEDNTVQSYKNRRRKKKYFVKNKKNVANEEICPNMFFDT